MTPSKFAAGWWLWIPKRKVSGPGALGSRRRSLTVQVPVGDGGRKPPGLEERAELFDEDHRPVPPSGASDGDGQVGFPLALVERQQESEQVLQPVQQLAAFPVLEHEVPHRRVLPVEEAQLVHEVGVGEEADVEDQVRVVRDPVLVAEGDQRHRQAAPALRLPVEIHQQLLELVDGQARGVHDPVGDLPDVGHRLPLGPDPVEDIAVRRERVPPAGLVVAADERLVPRFEEQHLRGVAPLLQLLEGLDEVGEVFPLPHIHAQGDPPDFAGGLGAERGEGRDERGRQVINAEVAHVLEALDGVDLPRPAEAGDDDETRLLAHPSAPALRDGLDQAQPAVLPAVEDVDRLGRGVGEHQELVVPEPELHHRLFDGHGLGGDAPGLHHHPPGGPPPPPPRGPPRPPARGGGARARAGGPGLALAQSVLDLPHLPRERVHGEIHGRREIAGGLLAAENPTLRDERDVRCAAGLLGRQHYLGLDDLREDPRELADLPLHHLAEGRGDRDAVAADDAAHPQRFLGARRRRWEGRIASSSRYLATVRRAMTRPRPFRTWAISWSESGLAASSASSRSLIIFLTDREETKSPAHRNNTPPNSSPPFPSPALFRAPFRAWAISWSESGLAASSASSRSLIIFLTDREETMSPAPVAIPLWKKYLSSKSPSAVCTYLFVVTRLMVDSCMPMSSPTSRRESGRRQGSPLSRNSRWNFTMLSVTR